MMNHEITLDNIRDELHSRNVYQEGEEVEEEIEVEIENRVIEEDKKTSKATIAGVVMAAIALVMMTGK